MASREAGWRPVVSNLLNGSRLSVALLATERPQPGCCGRVTGD